VCELPAIAVHLPKKLAKLAKLIQAKIDKLTKMCALRYKKKSFGRGFLA
jgi:hypothetical protein